MEQCEKEIVKSLRCIVNEREEMAVLGSRVVRRPVAAFFRDRER